MTTHRGAWRLRAGVVAVLAVGALVGAPAPAFAQNPTVTITQLSPTTLGAGQSATLRYDVEQEGGILNDEDPVQIQVSVGNGVTCSGACGSVETFAGRRSFQATLRAPGNLPEGSNRTVTVTVSADGQGQDDSKSVQLTLRGPDAPQAVRSVSGEVVDIDTGRGVSGADVALSDSAGHNYTTRTDGDGDFRFASSDNRPISPGRLLLAAGKEGFRNAEASTNASAGQNKSGLRLTLKSTASPTPSPTVESPTPEVTEEAPTDAPSIEESIDAAATGEQSSDSGGGLFSWVLIVLGGLLVALGVGAIVLLVVRRKEDGGDDSAGDPNPDPRGPRPTPGAQGVYRAPDATMVTGGAAAMGGSPTMPLRPGLADAPTMMHSAVDEYPDPYGSPLRAPSPTSGPPTAAQPGYGYQGAAPAGYGPGSPVGRAPTSASPDPYGAPGARDYPPPPTSGPGGYGYDEPTGRYDAAGYGPAAGQYDGRTSYEPDHYDGPAAGNGYPAAGNGYPAAGNGYPAAGGYGPSAGSGYDPAPASGGYDDRGAGYDEPTQRYGGQHSGYDDGYPPQSEYPPGGGYGGGQHGDGQHGGGYERVPEQRSAGYDQPRGYDQGYYDEPGPDRSPRPAPRRSLDWLDD